jgi:hypothetical protein
VALFAMERKTLLFQIRNKVILAEGHLVQREIYRKSLMLFSENELFNGVFFHVAFQNAVFVGVILWLYPF